jgi:hypothetical protein
MVNNLQKGDNKDGGDDDDDDDNNNNNNNNPNAYNVRRDSRDTFTSVSTPT